MRFNIKKSLLLGVLSFGLIGSVNAAELKFSNSTQRSETEIAVPVSIINVGEETITKVKIGGCQASIENVSCSVVSLGTPDLSYTNSNDGMLITAVDKFVSNTSLVEVVLRGEFNGLSDFTVTLDSDTAIEDVMITPITQTVKPKTTVTTTTVPKSSDSKLSNFSSSKGTIYPDFEPNVFEYTIYQIPDTINSIKLNSTCQTGECNISITGGKSVNGTQVTLNQGENIVNLLVTSEDGTSTDTYVFKIYRGETSFNSAKLKSLSFGKYDINPVFNADKKEYTLNVPYIVDDLTEIMTYEALDTEATVEVTGHDNLVVGLNTVTIQITNSLKTEVYTYTINVSRLKSEEIDVTKYIDNKVTFKNSEGDEVVLSIEEFKEQYPTDYKKIVNKIYSFDKDGNRVTITKEEPKKKSKLWLVILIIFLGLGIIGGSGYFIFRKQKPKDKNNKKDSKLEEVEVKENVDEAKEDESITEEVLDETFADQTSDVEEALKDLMNTKELDIEE